MPSIACAPMTIRTVDIGWANFVFALLPCALVMASPRMASAAEPYGTGATGVAPAAPAPASPSDRGLQAGASATDQAPGTAGAPAVPMYPPAPVAYPPPPAGYPPPPAARYPSNRPSYPPEVPEEPERPARKKGLMIAGLATLGGTYLFSALVGVELLSYEDSHPGEICLNCNSTGKALLVPIAGPWIALPDANSHSGGKVVCALLGLAQATGVVLSIVGISRYVSSGKPEASASSGVMVGVVPTQGGAFGSVGSVF